MVDSCGKAKKGTLAVFWKIEEPNQSEGQDEVPDGKQRRRFVLRYYRLFNLEQCELPRRIIDKLPRIDTHQHEPIATCAEIIGCMPNRPELVHGGTKAFYSPSADRVTLPRPELFTSVEEYYASAYHELTHYADFPIMPRCSSEPSQVMLWGHMMSA